MMTDTDCFRDTQESLYNFIEEYLVVCPKCSSCARVVPLDRDCHNQFDPRRVTCQSFSYSKD